jgi:hypothetical protein
MRSHVVWFLIFYDCSLRISPRCNSPPPLLPVTKMHLACSSFQGSTSSAHTPASNARWRQSKIANKKHLLPPRWRPPFYLPAARHRDNKDHLGIDAMPGVAVYVASLVWERASSRVRVFCRSIPSGHNYNLNVRESIMIVLYISLLHRWGQACSEVAVHIHDATAWPLKWMSICD